MPGTNATSLWSTLPTVNGPNLADVQSGANVCPHHIIGTLSWHTGHHHLSLFYHGYRPGAYSYMYANDLNGDGIVNDLLYIPRDDSEIHFDTDADRQAFWQYVELDDYLRSHKGSYAEAYAVHAPWVHKFDLHWSFEMGLRMGNIQHKLELLVDVDNITNFFNSRWGVTQVLANPRILTVKSVTNGVPTFTSTVAPGASSFVYSSNSAQCWKVCLGLRYHFN